MNEDLFLEDDEDNLLIDFETDENESISSLQVAPLDIASISEVFEAKPVKSKIIHPQNKWYQQYSVSSKYEARHDSPPPKKASKSFCFLGTGMLVIAWIFFGIGVRPFLSIM